MPINVFLDTSVLPRNPTGVSAEYRALAELAEENEVAVYLSTVVYREWVTQKQGHFLSKAAKSEKAVRDLIRDDWSRSIAIHPRLIEIDDWFSRNRQTVAATAGENAAAVLDQLRPSIINIQKDHAASAFDGYFQGHPPFASVKSRDDIPDAFIFESLKGLLHPEDHVVHAVIADGNLREAADTLAGVQTHESLRALFELTAIVDAQNNLLRANTWRRWLDHRGPELRSLSDEIESEVRRIAIDVLAYKTVNHDEIPDDNCDGIISGIDEAENIDIDWDNYENFGVGILSMPIEFDVSVAIDFHVYRTDAFSVPDGVSVSMGDFERDHYFEAEADVNVHVKANAVFRIPNNEIDDESIATIDDFALEDDLEIEVIEDEFGVIFR